jgi:hypothetical protein
LDNEDIVDYKFPKFQIPARGKSVRKTGIGIGIDSKNTNWNCFTKHKLELIRKHELELIRKHELELIPENMN